MTAAATAALFSNGTARDIEEDALAQVIADRRDIDFVLYEQLEVTSLLKSTKFQGLTRKMFDMIVNEARTFGIREILPTYAEGDRRGARFEQGRVSVPECFQRPYRLFAEGDWIAMAEDPAVGGQGLPVCIRQAAYEYIIGANFAFSASATLGHGTAKMIELFGTPRQKELFLEKIYSGEWGGTMLLTEPEAGSDVGALNTTAVKSHDGTYSLSGNKIFITCGEHDLTANIVHPVLARIEGAPAGTKGISLFIVPKIWVNDDGSLGEPNDIVCTGIEEKMGLHGSPTCSMTLGGKGSCRGQLLGEANKGMQVMFHMMKEARLDVGFQGFMHGSAAFLYALDYARQRHQGRALEQSGVPDAPSVPIIDHPDVRRMLLQMKAYVDGMRSFVYYVAYCIDRRNSAEDEGLRRRYGGLVDLLTPVVKAYCSERGLQVCDQAVQVYGGYGYTKEYPVEQLMRDCKITTIYEGTNGIQAMDLLGRKLGMQSGAVFIDFLKEIDKTISAAAGSHYLQRLAAPVKATLERFAEVARHLAESAHPKSPAFRAAFAHAHPFMEAMGDLIMAWMLLWRAAAAGPRLEKIVGSLDPKTVRARVAENKEAAFYDGQLKSAEYFIGSVLPVTMGKIEAIDAVNGAAVQIDDRSFGG